MPRHYREDGKCYENSHKRCGASANTSRGTTNHDDIVREIFRELFLLHVRRLVFALSRDETRERVADFLLRCYVSDENKSFQSFFSICVYECVRQEVSLLIQKSCSNKISSKSITAISWDVEDNE